MLLPDILYATACKSFHTVYGEVAVMDYWKKYKDPNVKAEEKEKEKVGSPRKIYQLIEPPDLIEKEDKPIEEEK